jgi:hypothetical protein
MIPNSYNFGTPFALQNASTSTNETLFNLSWYYKMNGIYLTCIQCGSEFEFSPEQQQRFQSKGFDPPLRCELCRQHKIKSETWQPRKKRTKRRTRLRQSAEIM